MKTLDEVIDTFEWCMHDDDADCSQCPYYTGKDTDCHDRNVDTLYYLKKLKRIEEKIEKIAIGNVEDTLSKIDNPPLTWSELKQMEGKPVWVEDNIDEPEDVTKYWAIYKRIDKAQETEYALLSDFYYDKAEYGKTWNAYRKERHELDQKAN